jgi:hypothetical protein
MIQRFIFKVIRAWWYYLSGTNSELMKSRLSICGDCELRKWFVCSKCGCPLNAKASDPDEHCPHPKGDMWQFIDFYYKAHPLKTETFETRSDI